MNGYLTFPKALVLPSPSDGFVSYPKYALAMSYLSSEIYTDHSINSADWAPKIKRLLIIIEIIVKSHSKRRSPQTPKVKQRRVCSVLRQVTILEYHVLCVRLNKVLESYFPPNYSKSIHLEATPSFQNFMKQIYQ